MAKAKGRLRADGLNETDAAYLPDGCLKPERKSPPSHNPLWAFPLHKTSFRLRRSAAAQPHGNCSPFDRYPCGQGGGGTEVRPPRRGGAGDSRAARGPFSSSPRTAHVLLFPLWSKEARHRSRGAAGSLNYGSRRGKGGAVGHGLRLREGACAASPAARPLSRQNLSDKMGKGCKVVVCGAISVGKTAILEQLLYGNHVIGKEGRETVEDVYVASVETDRGVKEQLRLYDTRGLQEGVELPKHYFSFADGFVLVYCVNDMESFRRVETVKRDIDRFRDKKEVVIVVLGNKSDLSEQRQVDADMAQLWARNERVRLWEVTVTDRKTLIEPFILLASKLTQPQSKSTFPLPGRKNKGSATNDN